MWVLEAEVVLEHHIQLDNQEQHKGFLPITEDTQGIMEQEIHWVLHHQTYLRVESTLAITAQQVDFPQPSDQEQVELQA